MYFAPFIFIAIRKGCIWNYRAAFYLWVLLAYRVSLGFGDRIKATECKN